MYGKILDEIKTTISNQYDLSPIFNQLNSNVNSPDQLKSSLISQYPTQSQQINYLFGSYYGVL